LCQKKRKKIRSTYSILIARGGHTNKTC